MPAPFPARTLTLGELFSDAYRLTVPDFQRAYSWTTEQAGQLLDDLLLALDQADEGQGWGDDDYFLGAMVLMEQPGPAEAMAGTSSTATPTHDIIDGLQRLITLTIILAVARDLALDSNPETSARAALAVIPSDDGPDQAKPRLTLAVEEQPFFWAVVQEPGAASVMPEDDDLNDAEQRILDVREHLLASLLEESDERLGALVRFLLDHCHCTVISASTIDHAHRIFSVLNDRGQPLTRGDILKARLLGNIPPDRRGHYREAWGRLQRRLGGSLEELLSQIRTIEGRSRNRIIDDIRALIARSGSAQAFLDDVLLPYGGILATIRAAASSTPADDDDNLALDPRIANRLAYLGWLGSSDWVAPTMLWWRLADGDPDALAPFLLRIDRLAYCMRFLGLGADKRAVRYQAVIDAMRSDDLEAPNSPLNLTRDEQRLIAYNLRSLHARSQLTCKLLLLRINDEIAGEPQGLDPRKLTVEHVLPQKTPGDSQWREWFPVPEERERCTQSLGNLILVSRDKNERARNLDLARKLEIYFTEGAQPTPVLTLDIKDVTQWLPDDVLRREARMLAAMSALWDMELSQREKPPKVAERLGRARPAMRKPARRVGAG